LKTPCADTVNNYIITFINDNAVFCIAGFSAIAMKVELFDLYKASLINGKRRCLTTINCCLAVSK